MPVSDPQLRYATHTELADGVTTDFEVGFISGYINTAHIKCFSAIVDPETDIATDRTVHAVEVIAEDENSATVRIAPAVADGRTIVIFRDTTKTAMLVDYTEGSVMTKANLDLANRQLLMAIQEILDGMNINSLTLEETISTIISLTELIENIYQQVIEILANGGIVSVEPRVWRGLGDGATTDFIIIGADIGSPGFYDTYIDGVGMEPGVDYTIIAGATIADTVLRFTVAPPDDAVWFTVLRGYAKPYGGSNPITSLRLPIITEPNSNRFIDQSSEYALVRFVNSGESTATIKLIPDVEEALGNGSFVSFRQEGGQVTVVPETVDVTLLVPYGYVAKTRAEGSIISATCMSADGDVWALSGDLALDSGIGSTFANPMVSVASSGGVLSVNLALAEAFKLDLTENITSWAFSNPPTSTSCQSFLFRIKQDSTPRTVVWPSSFRWAGGAAGSVSTSSEAIDLLAGTSFDGGVTWQVALSKAYA